MRTLLTRAAGRLDELLPGFDITASSDVLARRARTWARPAVQMGVASALAFWLASRLAGEAAGYAPITAIVALGLGRERRLARSALLVTGLFLGVVAAELVTPVIGSGWWQIGLVMTVSAVAAGAVIGKDLAVTYATINAALLLTTPGSDGWIPTRLVAGLIGVGAALAMILLIAPPRPAELVRRRLDRAADLAADALDRSAAALASQQGTDDAGDRRRLMQAAYRLDDEIDASCEAEDHARELVRWSPRRRGEAGEVRRLAELAHDLRPALRTASTIARLADRASLVGERAPEALVRSVRDGATAVADLTHHVLAGEQVGGQLDAGWSDIVGRVMEVDVDHAVLVALKEEVRGLVADLANVGGEATVAATATRASARGREHQGVTYGVR